MFFYIWSKKITPLVTGMQWGESEQVAEFSFLISLPESYLVDIWGSGKYIFGWLASALWLTHWGGCKKAIQGKLKLLNGVTGIKEGGEKSFAWYWANYLLYQERPNDPSNLVSCLQCWFIPDASNEDINPYNTFTCNCIIVCKEGLLFLDTGPWSAYAL